MRIRAVLLLLALLGAGLAAGQPPTKRIYIAPDDHTDYLWSGDEEDYRQAFVEMIDYYLDLADATDSNRPEHQSRWNCDGNFWLWTYERNKTAAEFERLLSRLRDGHISAPLNALVSCYGAAPAEAVLRGMYYAGRLERKHGIRFPLAVAMENQTLPYGLGALWAGSGARYSWRGICGCLTKLKRHERRPHEIYWWEGADGSRVLMKWNSLLGENKSLGGYAEAWDPAKSVDFVDQDAEFQRLYPYPVIGVFGRGWDNLKTLTGEFVTVAREMTTPRRKVIVSNEADFFRDFEAEYGDDLPVFSGSFGNEWDLYSASLAEVSGRVRRSVEKLRAAEALATLVTLKRPEFLAARRAARDQAFMDLGLYWEHNWTADGPVITRQARGDWQRRLARRIESYVEDLLADSAYALGGLIPNPGDTQRFYAFNPLGWARSDYADILFDNPDPVHVVDLETGDEIPSQRVTLPEYGYHKGRRYLRVLATDVPPAGYKVYEIRRGEGRELAPAAQIRDGVIENALYKIEIEERGAITSLVDKMRGDRELIRPVDGFYANDLGLGGGTLTVENEGPVSVTLLARGSSPIPHVSRVTLYRESPRIDIRNEITGNFDDVRTWAFSFNIDSPDVWHEELGAVIRARLLADGGHYSGTNSRLEWLTLNHFADMSDRDGVGVTLSNHDCAFMKLGRSSITEGVSRLDRATPQISVLAGGQVDGPSAGGIPAQGGDDRFLQRFALATHGGFDQTRAMKFSLEHQNPLVARWVRGGSDYPEKSYSLLEISDPDILLWSLKPAEEGIGHGIIARVWSMSPSRKRFALSISGGLRSASRATHIETDIGDATVSGGVLRTEIEGSQILTFRLKVR